MVKRFETEMAAMSDVPRHKMASTTKGRRTWIMFVYFTVYWSRCEGTAPPQIAPFRVLEDLLEGQRLSLLCSATMGTPPISFSWTKDGKPVTFLPDTKVALVDDDQQQLKIEKLSSEHVGNYTCSARNAFGSDQMSVSVVLKFRPRWVTSGSSVLTAVAGEALKVDCEAIGHPPPTIKIIKGTFALLNFFNLCYVFQ